MTAVHRTTQFLTMVALLTAGVARTQAQASEDDAGKPAAATSPSIAAAPDGVPGPRVADTVARAAAINGDHAARLQFVLEFAQAAQQRIDAQVRDYTCVLVKRERVEGRVGNYQYMVAKVRHEQRDGDEVTVPFSVFIRFLKPERMEGREVIYVQNQNQGDLIARRGGRRSPNVTVQLPPDSPMAMDGNRYPITEIGFRNLTRRVIEVLEQERQYNDGVIEIFPDAKVDGRQCTHFRLTHAQRRPDLTYHMAELSVDDELEIPVYFRSFDFPAQEGEKPRLLEEYFYKRVKINVGLTDLDFDITNPEYHFQVPDPEADAEQELAAADDDAAGPEATTDGSAEDQPVDPAQRTDRG